MTSVSGEDRAEILGTRKQPEWRTECERGRRTLENAEQGPWSGHRLWGRNPKGLDGTMPGANTGPGIVPGLFSFQPY